MLHKGQHGLMEDLLKSRDYTTLEAAINKLTQFDNDEPVVTSTLNKRNVSNVYYLMEALSTGDIVKVGKYLSLYLNEKGTKIQISIDETSIKDIKHLTLLKDISIALSVVYMQYKETRDIIEANCKPFEIRYSEIVVRCGSSTLVSPEIEDYLDK